MAENANEEQLAKEFQERVMQFLASDIARLQANGVVPEKARVLERKIAEFLGKRSQWTPATDLYFYGDEGKAAEKFSKATHSYARLSGQEIPLVCFDATLSGSSDEGFLATTETLYARNKMEKRQVIPLVNIAGITLSSERLFVTNVLVVTKDFQRHVIEALSDQEAAVEALSAWVNIFAEAKAPPPEASPSSPKFCRFCGKPLQENAKFCVQCGKRIA